MSDQLSHATPRARKPHRCDECETTIEAGTTYIRQTVASDGTVGTYKAHAECWKWAVEAQDDRFDTCRMIEDPVAFAEGAPDVVRARLLGGRDE